MTHGLLVHNPYVYKGYYYDSDTGYYYLKSRYYDPRIHRFLSADKIDYLDPKSLSSLNLYVYCGDNPVMMIDENGCTPWWQWTLAGLAVAGLIVGAVLTANPALIGAAIGGSISLISQGLSGELNWGQLALDIGVGALSGAIGASGISRFYATIAGAAIGGISNAASQMIKGASFNELNWGRVAICAGIGGVAGLIGGAGAKNDGAINSATKVTKAMNSVNKVLARIQEGNYYSSARYAQTAFTNAANRLGSAVISQQIILFSWSMMTYSIGTAISLYFN